MSGSRISPSDDFTGKVMAEVKKRPRKIGLWNLVYFAPVALAILLVSLPMTRDAVLYLTSEKHVAVSGVQREVDQIQSTVNQLNQFEFDEETIEVMNYASTAE